MQISMLLRIKATVALIGVAVAQSSTRASNTSSISSELFASLERCSRLADITYCVTPPATGISRPFDCLSRCAEFSHFELITAWNTGPLLSDTAGFVAYDHEQDENGNGKVVIAFRGTYSIANAVVDLSTIPQAYTPYPGEDDEVSRAGDEAGLSQPRCNNCSVHIGFNRAWRNTRDLIMEDVLGAFIFHPRYELVLVGHSLGGAVAMLAGLEFLARGFRPTVTTFGEPRVGNSGLAEYVDDRFDLNSTVNQDRLRYRRVTHLDDPVPLLPLTEWQYAMHAGEIFISKAELPPEIEDVHHCHGDHDQSCIAQQDETLIPSVRQEMIDVRTEPWGIPSRYKLWQLFFAHRDYFHRIGVCLAGGDPLAPEPTDVLKEDL